MSRVVFMGTPAFAVPSLEAVVALPGVEVVTVITQPDRPAGRGRALRPSAVRLRAEALALPVWTPERLRGEEAQARLRALAPDVMVVVAYGEILRPAVLAIPPRGILNVHASLLPRHRGAAPVAAAIREGDEMTGVTIMLMDAGMDTGPILATEATPIGEEETRGTLGARLAQMGADLLARTLPRWIEGRIEPQPQPAEGVTTTRLLKRADGRIDWHRPATAIANQMRAYDPWPGSFTTWEGQALKLWGGRAATAGPEGFAPGTLLEKDGVVGIVCGEGWLQLDQVQPPGRPRMGVRDFLNGHPELVGHCFGAEERANG